MEHGYFEWEDWATSQFLWPFPRATFLIQYCQYSIVTAASPYEHMLLCNKTGLLMGTLFGADMVVFTCTDRTVAACLKQFMSSKGLRHPEIIWKRSPPRTLLILKHVDLSPKPLTFWILPRSIPNLPARATSTSGKPDKFQPSNPKIARSSMFDVEKTCIPSGDFTYLWKTTCCSCETQYTWPFSIVM